MHWSTEMHEQRAPRQSEVSRSGCLLTVKRVRFLMMDNSNSGKRRAGSDSPAPRQIPVHASRLHSFLRRCVRKLLPMDTCTEKYCRPRAATAFRSIRLITRRQLWAMGYDNPEKRGKHILSTVQGSLHTCTSITRSIGVGTCRSLYCPLSLHVLKVSTLYLHKM